MNFHAIPKPGLVVLDPVSFKQLPPEGASVPRNGYWLTMLRDDAVTERQAPVSNTQKPDAPADKPADQAKLKG